MATSKPAVSAYLEPHLYQQLTEFKDAHQLRSLSQAVEVILHEYFGGETCTSLPTQPAEPMLTLAERVDRLNASYEFLNQSVLSIQQLLLKLSSGSSHNLTLNNLKNTLDSLKQDTLAGEETSKDFLKTEEWGRTHPGLTGTDLAVRLNTSPSTISRRRSKPSFQIWSRRRDPEKMTWVYSGKKGGYFPIVFDE